MIDLLLPVPESDFKLGRKSLLKRIITKKSHHSWKHPAVVFFISATGIFELIPLPILSGYLIFKWQ